MCGIVGYIGVHQAYPYLHKGLQKLEYRGYDSAGIALHQHNKINIIKKAGKVKNLTDQYIQLDTSSNLGIGHTRWATHGVPSDENAHPHFSNSKNLALVHNGIIENYATIKKELIEKGFHFHSDTDSEVLVNLIEDIYSSNDYPLEDALQIALKKVTGTYVVLLVDQNDPQHLFAAKKGSPLAIGVGQNEFFLASDISPILEYSKEIVYIEDFQLVKLSTSQLILKNANNEIIVPTIQTVDIRIQASEKGEFTHYMLKEIYEQPASIRRALLGRIDQDPNPIINLPEMETIKDKLVAAKRIVMVACGTSWHAALLAEYWIEELCRVQVEVEYASEYRYRNPIIDKGDIIIAISQSGETADTLVALENAKKLGATVLGIVNVLGSSIARISDACLYTHAGPEIGVASTKAFTAQLSVLLLFAIKLGAYKKTISDDLKAELIQELALVPQKIQSILDDQVETINQIANKYFEAKDFLYLGRGYNFPIALEGALKLKEVSYIHAEGYPAAEMKHGPIALVDANLPVVFVTSKDRIHEKIISNIQEIKARGGKIISVVTRDDQQSIELSDDYMQIPHAHEIISPILAVVPLQLLSYAVGIVRQLDVDKPRNLAKSVTVE